MLVVELPQSSIFLLFLIMFLRRILPFNNKCKLFKIRKLRILILIWFKNYGKIVDLTGSGSANLGPKLTFKLQY
jgi:hypothetical protein